MLSTLFPAPSDTDAEFARLVDELTRRGFLAGGLSTAGLLGLAACGSDGTPSAGGGSGLWTFTDDLGHTLRLARTPKRVAVLANSLAVDAWAAGLRPVAAPLSIITPEQLKAVGFDIAGVTDIVNNDGSFNLEKVAEARPDLLVDQTDGKTSFSVASTPKLKQIAPVVAINNFTQPIAGLIGSVDRLVTALHDPLRDRSAEKAYQAAAGRVRAAAAAKPGLRVCFAFEGSNGAVFLVAVPSGWTFTRTLRQLGVNLLAATGKDGAPYQTVSWELVPSLPADLVIYQNYQGTSAPSNPAWQQIPAVKAGQFHVVGPNWGGPDTYAYWATALDQIAGWIQQAEPGIGPR